MAYLGKSGHYWQSGIGHKLWCKTTASPFLSVFGRSGGDRLACCTLRKPICRSLNDAYSTDNLPHTGESLEDFGL